MPTLLKLEAPKTYATEANAAKAVARVYGDRHPELTYIIVQNEAGRFFPLFFGERAVRAGVHFHFNVAA